MERRTETFDASRKAVDATDHTLRAIFEFVKVQLRKRGIRQILQSIFSSLALDERDEGAREFAAAAEAAE